MTYKPPHHVTFGDFLQIMSRSVQHRKAANDFKQAFQHEDHDLRMGLRLTELIYNACRTLHSKIN